MAKELPYFKFFCSEWSDGDITLEDYNIQGLFINVCSYYWSNECSVTLNKLYKRFKANKDNLDYLFSISLIHENDGFLSIHFLDEQSEERKYKSKVNSLNGSKGGRPKKPKESETKPNALFSLSETKGNKKREEKKREEKNLENIKIDFCNVYPKAGNPFEILAELQTLPKDEQKKAVDFVPTYLKNTEKKFYKSPINYLKSYCWNDKIGTKTQIIYE